MPFGGKKEKFSYDEAKDILFSVKQSYTGELTSFTQYSAIYNQTDLTVDIYPFTEPNNKKTIKLEK